MSEGRIEVTMPRALTKSLGRMDETLIGLKTSFRSLYEILEQSGRVLERQTQVIERVPDMLQTLQQTMQQQFELAVLRQIESLVLQQQAAILADERRLSSLQTFLDRKNSELKVEQTRIHNRYEKLLTQIAEDNLERRERLDAHAYALLEDVYPQQIEAAFSSRSLPSFKYLAAHATECAAVRSNALLDSLLHADEDAAVVESRAEAFEDRLRLLTHPLEPGSYEIPAFQVVLDHCRNGRRRTELRFGRNADLRGAESGLRGGADSSLELVDYAALRSRLVERGILHEHVIDALFPDSSRVPMASTRS